MPSSTTNNRPANTATRPSYGKRQARAARRAYERQRRNRILVTIATIVVVGAIVALFITHNPFANLGHATAKATVSPCPAPTATAIGPVPLPTPPASPPKVTGKTVNGDQGLQYIDITAGCGPTVKATNVVTVMYNGWLQSTGKLFDSSLSHGGTFVPGDSNGNPAPIGQAQVIVGWQLGIIGMKPGGVRRLIIPAAIAYGAQGQPPTIPANSTLIFDITLVSIDS